MSVKRIMVGSRFNVSVPPFFGVGIARPAQRFLALIPFGNSEMDVPPGRISIAFPKGIWAV